MVINITDIIKLNIYEIKVNNRTILLNNKNITLNIEYILLTSLNVGFQLKFFDIYENLKFSAPVFFNSTIEYDENKISINTIKK